MTNQELITSMLAKIDSLPKPVTSDDILEVASKTLDGHTKQQREFFDWFNKNGKQLLTRLNE